MVNWRHAAPVALRNLSAVGARFLSAAAEEISNDTVEFRKYRETQTNPSIPWLNGEPNHLGRLRSQHPPRFSLSGPAHRCTT
jgi:hypothetical protein